MVLIANNKAHGVTSQVQVHMYLQGDAEPGIAGRFARRCRRPSSRDCSVASLSALQSTFRHGKLIHVQQQNMMTNKTLLLVGYWTKTHDFVARY